MSSCRACGPRPLWTKQASGTFVVRSARPSGLSRPWDYSHQSAVASAAMSLRTSSSAATVSASLAMCHGVISTPPEALMTQPPRLRIALALLAV